MRQAIFPFFRATFYRWAELWPEICPECAGAPALLAAGDLDVENFGTWRDIEGRLIWGINDFDEASRMPYTIDLVRLATSAHLAIETEQLEIARRDACNALLAGHRECLESGGRPWVLGGEHPWCMKWSSQACAIRLSSGENWNRCPCIPAACRAARAAVFRE
ncbi:MAG TPA: DUF2252 family protein [Bryobacteraceae bacterium]|nr:DUF2252 family protein [Bryobacteraceae bacterium]